MTETITMHRTCIKGQPWSGWKMGPASKVGAPYETEEAVFYRTSAAGAVKAEPVVKPLEWVPDTLDTLQGETSRWVTKSIIGWYVAFECYGECWYETPTHKDFDARPASSIEDAKAACQADFNARVLTTLTLPTPTRDVTAERDAYAQGCKDVGEIVRHNITRAEKAENQLTASQAQVATLREALEKGRANSPDVMRALLEVGGRDYILLADRVHKADDCARAALNPKE